MSRRKTFGIAAAMVAMYLAVLVATLPAYGLTDDDDFYIPAGASYVKWMGRAVTFQPGAWSRASIDAAFTPNHEHPVVAKVVFGLCRAAFEPWLGVYDGSRVGAALFSALLAAMLLWLAIRHLGAVRGLRTGGLAVLFLLFLPRFFFHSHAATLDVPVASLYVVAATAALFAERSKKAAWAAGIAFGLACSTKLNAPFLVIPYGIFALLVRRGVYRPPAAKGGLRLPSVPLALVSMGVIGPLVFFALWPWIWFDTIQRVGQYIGFHLNHYGIYFLYFGTVFSKNPNAPWHAPFTMAAITTPLAISALAIAGVVLGAGVVRARLCYTDGPDDDRRREGDLVLTAILHAGFSIAVVAFSGGPKYGGAKLFMPFFPFWCLLAGYGASRIYEELAGTLKTKVAAVAVIVLAAVSSFSLEWKFGAYALSEYNALVGGLRGATAVGFERQYYDVAFRDLVKWLNENAPKNARVHFLPNNWEYVRTYKYYRESGELRSDLRVVDAESQASLLVLTHERRFSRYAEDLRRYRTKPVLEERIVDGTPIWSVLQR